MKRLVQTAGLFVLSVFLLAGSASAATAVYVRIGPPAAVVETHSTPPHAGYVWRSGYHRWDGHHYVWVRGGWVRPPYQNAAWVSARWDHERRGYHYVPGHWVRH
jgi:uncharacterized membrane protein